ncbi:MAG: hypothetical protein LUG60_09625 [Erysipelotrichaceae bacterium]|nr:hypothetical protein [Erysipelotrichaceae bacterium]
MIKKITKEIEKLEKQKVQKTDRKNQLDKDITIINSRLKELNNLKTQYEKLSESTDTFFEKINVKNNE